MTLKEHVALAPLTEAKAQHLASTAWERHRSHLRARRGRAALVGLSAGALVLATAVWFLLAPSRVVPVTPPVASASSGPSFTFPDGSQVLAAADARLTVMESRPEEIRVAIARGSAVFDVTPRPTRAFVVVAPGATIEVLGTRFEVSVIDVPSRTTAVHVERGTVRVVSESGREHTLTAGERVQLVGSADTTSAPSGAVSATAAPPRAASDPASEARRLFERASQARRAGDAAAAMRGYEELVARFPNDRHAQLAALELGRMRMKEDPRAAATALERASEGEGPLSGDALANLVMAYDRSGDLPRCRAARARYLAEYPRGVQIREVRASCGGGSVR